LKYHENISPEEWEKIERFLTGSMSEAEATEFSRLIETDKDLSEKVDEIKIMLLGISEGPLQEKLQSFHSELVSVRPAKARVVPLARKWLVAASLLAIVGLSVWFLLQNRNTNKKIYSKYYTPDPGLATVMSANSNYEFEKAMVEYKNGEYEKALGAWTRLLKEKPGNDTLLYFLAVAYQASEKEDLALENFRKAVVDTNSIFYKDACWYLGLSYLKKGDKQQAIHYIQASEHPQKDAIINAINKN
jgi:tetratricopeptide (TPR) repeat protein